VVEKKAWKADMLDKVAEIESLQTREKQSNSLTSELSGRVEQLQSEIESTRAEAEMLVSCTSRSASEMEALRATLLLKQQEVERLDGERRGMERELCSVRRDAKASNETANRLRELNRQHELQCDEMQHKAKELSEELCKSHLEQHKLQSKCDFLEKEMDAMTKSHKEDVSSITSTFSKIEEQHVIEAQSKETIIDKLRRTLSQMESDNSSIQREKQSLDQRCLSLTSLLDSIRKDHQTSFQEILHRAIDTENQLERRTKEVEVLKKTVVQLEARVQIIQTKVGAKEATLMNDQSSLQDELTTKARQNEALSKQVERLREEAKQVQQAHTKAVVDLQQETQDRIRLAEMECEKMRALIKGHQLNAKRSEDLQEKQSLMYQALLDEMAAQKNDQREQMETVIQSERDVSTRLMTKTQELNSTINKLSADHFLLKEAQYGQRSKIQQLEQIVACGEAKLRTISSSYCKLSDEQEHLIRREAETKRKLHQTNIELEKMKAATQNK
jgi:predicted  nucleic acid-binding Zn-ribbon protein